MNKYYVETRAYLNAKKTFDKNGIVILTGPPGCGKTIAAIHMILDHMNDEKNDMTFRKIESWEELNYIDQNDEHTIIFIDNIFFRRTVDLHLEKWWAQFEAIYNRHYARGNDEIESYTIRIVMTARQNAIETACRYMDKTPPVFHESFLKDVSFLTEFEKNNILTQQIKFAEEKRIPVENINVAFRRKVTKSDGPIGFPLCAHLYVCGKEYRKSGAKFFSHPIQYLKLQVHDEIESDKTNRTKSLFFFQFFYEWHIKMGNFEKLEMKEVYCRRFLDRISQDLLLNFDPFDFKNLENEAQRLSGTFFKKINDHVYRFVHDSVYEAVGAYLCEAYFIETTMYFPIDIIQNQDFENLSREHATTLATRLIYESLDQRLSEVFSCKVFRSAEFVKLFCSELKKKDTKTIENLINVVNESTSEKLPCMFWTSYNHHTLLTELLYGIAKERNINPDVHLYISLYAMCCARDHSLLRNTNGMSLHQPDKIKERVLHFKDNEDSCIHHLLIKSHFSDNFVAEAVEKLVLDGMVVDKRNKRRITALMLAVEQNVQRTEVIKTLVKLSEKLSCKDENNSNVLHHCLESCNDDEKCSNYLNIILKKCARGAIDIRKELLSINDTNGDTALSIAAKCLKCSRIMSILILLQSDVDIINTLSEVGYSPLHLAVSSLSSVTKEPALVELECCVRVIIFILYGANLDNKSDTNDKAIDECRYKSVQNILQYPEDQKNMEKELIGLLKKWGKDVSNIQEHQLLSKNRIMSKELRIQITHAINLLKNCYFRSQ